MTTEHLDPARSDHLLRLLTRLFGRNPFLVAFWYAAVSFGGTLALAGLKDPQLLAQALADTQNRIVQLVLVPLGIFLLMRFYDQVREGFGQIVADGVVQFASDDARDAWLAHADRRLNRRGFFWVALVAAIAVNASFLASLDPTAWNAPSQGLHAWWFRLFALTGIYATVIVVLKGIATVLAVREVFEPDKEVLVQPLHPDGCGGLRSLGSISISLNFFLSLVAVYMFVLAFVGGDGRGYAEIPGFIPAALAFLALATWMFFAPLAKAHAVIDREKDDVLSKLSAAFQRHYTMLMAAGMEHEDASHLLQEIERLERLYRIASDMPVWPLDMRILAQFGATLALPIGALIEIWIVSLGD